SAYDMLHRARLEWPCLSFAVVPDALGEDRAAFPHTAYFVAGTQAEARGQNRLLCLKMSAMHRTKHDDESGAQTHATPPCTPHTPWQTRRRRHLRHPPPEEHASPTRVRTAPRQAPHVCATWCEDTSVRLWDLSHQLGNLHAPGKGGGGASARGEPLKTFGGHGDEGYALDWSPVASGALASADCAGKIHAWRGSAGGGWAVDAAPYEGHVGSVEDVQWSPVEAGVFMSCGVDSSVRVWDRRARDTSAGASAITVDEQHGADVNVISWSKQVNYLVVSGADDGSFRVWDLRSIRSGEPVALFTWHRGPITSVEWSPHESGRLAADQVTLWDLALEDDPEADSAARGRDDLRDLPPQLYFVHQGQRDMKEARW
ncbi:hypothetical protein EMIHUDRAFT_72572, partial [Emiliania huxleyi CCMP1516]|uniref:Glutamate-rich WD repeat-containing protein 1 n=2 Tax=Emiliania huxleyi TaxID=2903 RepID=A0A0D3K4D3_EMIH1